MSIWQSIFGPEVKCFRDAQPWQKLAFVAAYVILIGSVIAILVQ